MPVVDKRCPADHERTAQEAEKKSSTRPCIALHSLLATTLMSCTYHNAPHSRPMLLDSFHVHALPATSFTECQFVRGREETLHGLGRLHFIIYCGEKLDLSI